MSMNETFINVSRNDAEPSRAAGTGIVWSFHSKLETIETALHLNFTSGEGSDVVPVKSNQFLPFHFFGPKCGSLVYRLVWCLREQRVARKVTPQTSPPTTHPSPTNRLSKSGNIPNRSAGISGPNDSTFSPIPPQKAD